MNEEYLKGLHGHLGIEDDFDTWVSSVKDNDDYLKGVHGHIGIKDDYDTWKTSVWSSGDTPVETVEPTEPKEEQAEVNGELDSLSASTEESSLESNQKNSLNPFFQAQHPDLVSEMEEIQGVIDSRPIMADNSKELSRLEEINKINEGFSAPSKSIRKIYSDQIAELDAKIFEQEKKADRLSKNSDFSFEEIRNSDGTYEYLKKQRDQIVAAKEPYEQLLRELKKDTNSDQHGFLGKIGRVFGINAGANQEADETITLSSKVEEQILVNLQGDNRLQGKIANGYASLAEKENFIAQAKVQVVKSEKRDILEEAKVIKETITDKAIKQQKLEELDNRFNSLLGEVGYDQATGMLKNNFQKTTESKEFDELVSSDGFFHSTADAVGSFLEGVVQTGFKGTVGFTADMMSGLGDMTTEQDDYSVFDAFGDTVGQLANYNYLPSSKKKNARLLDGDGDLNLNYKTVTKSLAEVLPFTLAIVNDVKKGKITNVEKALGKLLNPTKSAKMTNSLKLIDSAYRHTLSDNLNMAEELGLGDNKGRIFANTLSMAEGMAELVMPDTRFFKSTAGNAILGTFKKDLKTATTKTAISNVVKNFTKNMALELGEEELVLATEDLLKFSMVVGHENSEFFDMKRQKELAAATVIMSGALGGANLKNDFKGNMTEIYKDISDNINEVSDSLQEELDSDFHSPEIKEEIKNSIEWANNMNVAIKKSPASVTGEQIDLLMRKQELLTEMKSVDDAFHPQYKAKIEAINEKINPLNAKKETKSESKTGTSKVNTEAKSETKQGGVQAEGTKKVSKLFSEPNPETATIASNYKKSKGIKTEAGEKITELDVEQSKEIADAYEAMEHNPNDPEVKEAYSALAEETLSQYKAMEEAGYEVEIYEGEGEPYANSTEMIADLKDNKHIYIFSTESGFGEGGISEQQRGENVMLGSTKHTDKNGKPLLINDVFRAVHDFFGHSERGNSFGAKGEENAWDVHARMYGDKARRAMTTETRGQNSWVNFGNQNRNSDGSIKKKGDEGYLSAKEKPFAEQKTGLLDKKYSEVASNSVYKKLASAVRSAKVYKTPSEALSKLQSNPAGLLVAAWDGALETVAMSIEAGGKIDSAIRKGLVEIKKSEWYNKLTAENKKKAIGIIEKDLRDALTPLSDAIVKKSKQAVKSTVRKNTGQVDQSKKITTTEAKLLKDKFKNLEKGSKLGAKEMKRIKGEFTKEISKGLKSLVNSKTMTVNEASRVLSAVNQLGEKNYDKVKTLVDKVISQIESKGLNREVKSLKSKVKKGSKSKRNPENIREAAKLATSINEKNLTNEGKQKYNNLLTELDKALSLATGKKYEMSKLDEIYSQLDQLTKESERGRLQSIAESAGLDGTTLSNKEIEELLQSENVDEYIENLKDSKRKDARLMLEKQASYSAIALNDVDTSGLSKKEKEYLKVLKSADLTSLTSTEIRDFIKVVDNIALNESFSSVGMIVTKLKAKEAAKEVSKLFTKKELGVIRDSKLTDLKTMSLIFKTVFRQTKKGAKFNTLSGLLDLSLKVTKYKSEMAKLGKDYETLLNKLYKKNNKIKKPKSVMLRAMASQLINGETQEDFDINMSRLDDHIKTLEANSELVKDRKLYEAQEEVYNSLKDFKNQDEVYNHIKSLNDGNSEILDFWLSHFDSNKESLAANTREFHGEPFKEVGGRYLPIKLVSSNLAKDSAEVKEDKDRPVYRQGMLSDSKASTTTITRNKSMKLPAGRLLDLDFDAAMFNAANKVSLDINTSESYQQVAEFLNSTELSEMFGKGEGGKQTSLNTIRDKVNEMRSLQLGESIGKGNDNVMKGVAKFERTVKKLGVINALGGVLQYPKQYLSVMSGSMVRLGTRSGLLVDAMFTDKSKIELLNLVSVTHRGETQGGTSSYSDRVSEEAKHTSARMAKELKNTLGKGLSKFHEASLFSLRKGDVNIAKSTWIAFYQDFLIKNNVDKKSIDMTTEHLKMDEKLRKDAISYAELMVEETQIPSDDTRASKFYQNPDIGAAILRSIFMPFQTFSINAKVRMLTNFSIIQDTNKSSSREDKVAAFSDLGAIGVEMLTFQTLKFTAMKFLVSLGKDGIEALFDLDSPDEDEEQKKSRNLKGWYSNLIKDINPFAIGALMEDMSIEGLNYIQYLVDDDSVDFEDYYEYQKSLDDGAMFYRYKGSNESRYGFDIDPLNSGGIYQTPFNQLKDTKNSFYSAFKGDGGRDAYGNKIEYDFTDNQQKFMYAAFLIDLLASAGIGDADIRRTIGKIKREQQKDAKQ